MQGDMFDIRWDFQWRGGNNMGSIERFDIELPVTDIPVHVRVSAFEEVMNNISMQVEEARALCGSNENVEIYMAGCPVKYSRD